MEFEYLSWQFILVGVILTIFFLTIFFSIWDWFKTKKDSGLKEGENIVYYENGQIHAKFKIKNGKHDGLSNAWFENGNKKSEVQFNNGLYQGLTTHFYENGNVKERHVWDKGLKNGLFQKYDENGFITEDGIFLNDKVIKLNEYYLYGVFRGTKYFKDDEIPDGQWIEYYENGNKKNEITYSDGKYHGIGRMYDENENLRTEDHWVNGKKVSSKKM
jgi:antitoxin component YwqK of YwqJK toxin-antitoxin module